MQSGAPSDDLEQLLAEQIAYYRARADEYDKTALFSTYEGYRELLAALEEFAPGGRVLELACGTGQWTVELANYATSLTAVDASPEMLAINRAVVGLEHVRYVEADLFTWSPSERYDVVFFSAWLSHVPPQRFDAFWELVGGALAEKGRVFLIDERPAVAELEETMAEAAAPAVRRALGSGARYRAVKVFYEPDELVERLTALGWRAEARAIGWRFFYATAARG